MLAPQECLCLDTFVFLRFTSLMYKWEKYDEGQTSAVFIEDHIKLIWF